MDLLVQLWIMYLLAASLKKGQNSSPLLKCKYLHVNDCCSACLTKRALHMFEVRCVTWRNPLESTEQRAPWPQM